MKPEQSLDVCDSCKNVVENNSGVVSLSEMRAPGHLEAITEHLIELLKDLYDSGIAIHNQMISQSRVSVLSELTSRLNIYFDLVPPELRSSLLTPFALYGRSSAMIYGKSVLQQRNRRIVSERESADLLENLQANPLQIWCYHHNAEGTSDLAHPLIGPEQGAAISMVGVITRAGKMTRASGHYSGWPVNFEGFWFLVCGYEHEERTVEIVKRKSERVEAKTGEEFWEAFELTLVHLLVDPLGSRYRPASQFSSDSSGWNNGYKPRRKEVINKILESLEHAFDADRELTPHAHIARLVEEEQGRAEFIERIQAVLEDVTLANRGPRTGESPVVLADILAAYCMSEQGVLKGTEGIYQHPVAVLLLDQDMFRNTPIDRMSTIREALNWARAQSGEHPVAVAVLDAWSTYRREQFWLAMHGFAVGSEMDPEARIQEYGRPGYLSDIHAVFDGRFLETGIDSLPLDQGSLGRFLRGFSGSKDYVPDAALRDLPTYEFHLRYQGVGKKTVDALLYAVLVYGREWRWKEAGLDSMGCSGLGLGDEGDVDSEVAASLQAGLDELADLFG